MNYKSNDKLNLNEESDVQGSAPAGPELNFASLEEATETVSVREADEPPSLFSIDETGELVEEEESQALIDQLDVMDEHAASVQFSGDTRDHFADGLDVATTAGEILLANGAEIFRVQDTMTRILKVYETEPFNVFVISNAIMANVERGGQAKSAVVRYIPLGPNHLGRVAKVNAISRQIGRGELSTTEAITALEEIRYSDDTNLLMRAVATAVGSAAFAVLAGGNATGFMVAALTSFVLYYFLAFLERFAIAKIMTNIIGAFFVSFLALLIVKGIKIVLPGTAVNFSNVIIGSIMQLVPGMSLTTAVREILNTDYLSGSIRIMDVITLGFGIAFGVFISLWIFQPLLGVY